MSDPCKGCVDWVICGGGMACDYIGHTGHARSLICPPGAGCTVKSTKPRRPLEDGRENNGRAYTWDTDTALKLYNDGWIDAQIAKELGIRQNQVWYWRTRRQLPANGKGGHQHKAAQHKNR